MIRLNTCLVLVFFICSVHCKHFELGVSRQDDYLVTFETLFIPRAPHWFTTADYKGRYQCGISYVQVVNRLGEGLGPKTKVIEGGLHKNNIVLTLISSYDQPLSVNIFVSCANENGTTPTTSTQPSSRTTPTTSTQPSIRTPDAPQSFSIVTMNEDEGSAKLKWEKPLDDGGRTITKYIIEYRVRGTSDKWKSDGGLDIPGSATTATQKGLNLKLHEYEFRVKAANMVGEGDASEEDYVNKPPKPSMPNIEDISVIKNTAHLKWSIIFEEELRRDIIGFLIEYREIGNERNEWKQGPKVFGKDSTEIFVDSDEWTLTEETLDMTTNQYEFRVQAYNIAGHGPPSRSITVGKPSAPRKFKIIKMTEDDNGYIVEVTWKIPESDGGKPIQNYNIQQRARKSEDEEWEDNQDVPGSDTSATLEVADSSYEYRVRARNMLDYGPPSDVDWADIPSKPRKLKVVDMSDTEAMLDWEEPEDMGGKDITHYLIKYRVKDSRKENEWKDGVTVDGNQTQATQPNLDVWKNEYEFHVVAENMVGLSDPSIINNMARPSAPLNFEILDISGTNGTAHLRWAPPENELELVKGYIIWYKVDDSEDWKYGPIVNGKDTMEILMSSSAWSNVTRDLSYKNKYKFGVQAFNPAGYGEPSNEDFVEKPSEPLNFSINYITGPIWHFNWQSPINNGGKKLTEYEVQLLYGSHWERGTTVPGTQREASLSGEESTKYRVRAANMLDYGKPSHFNWATKPSGPENVRISHFTLDENDNFNGVAAVEWTRKEIDGNLPITRYKVEVREKGLEYWKIVSFHHNTSSVNIRGLDKKKAYEYQVTAENVLGFGPPSRVTETQPCLDSSFVYYPDRDECYKYHSKQTWPDAYKTCRKENAFLWYPLLQADVDFMTRMVVKLTTEKVRDLWYGIQRDKDKQIDVTKGKDNDWKTIHGVSVGQLMYAGYFKVKSSPEQFIQWQNWQPYYGTDNYLHYSLIKKNYFAKSEKASFPFLCVKLWGKPTPLPV